MLDTSINNFNFDLGTNTNLNWSVDLFCEEAFPYREDSTIRVYPYQNIILNGSFNWLKISDLYENLLEWQNWTDSYQSFYEYTPANLRECFVSITDQSSNYIDWEQFKLKINGSLIYSNSFYQELGTNFNLSIWDRFDNYLISTNHTVSREDNYIPLTVNLYSLKIRNQEEQFIYLNMTQNNTSNSWTSWLSPYETEEYRLIPDTYDITIFSYSGENETNSTYQIDFSNDNILFITSEVFDIKIFLTSGNLTDYTLDFTDFSFTNLFRNKTVKLFLKYGDLIESTIIGPGDPIELNLPAKNVYYKVESLDGTYETQWEIIDDVEVDIGFYSEYVPEFPDTIISTEFRDYLVIGLIGAVIIVIIGFVAIDYRQKLSAIPSSEKPSRNFTGTRKSKKFFI